MYSKVECASSNQNKIRVIVCGKMENPTLIVSKPYFHLFNPYKIIVSIFQFNNLFNP